MIGPEAFARLESSRVAVFGVGGVGSYVADSRALRILLTMTGSAQAISPADYGTSTLTLGMAKSRLWPGGCKT